MWQVLDIVFGPNEAHFFCRPECERHGIGDGVLGKRFCDLEKTYHTRPIIVGPRTSTDRISVCSQYQLVILIANIGSGDYIEGQDAADIYRTASALIF